MDSQIQSSRATLLQGYIYSQYSIPADTPTSQCNRLTAFEHVIKMAGEKIGRELDKELDKFERDCMRPLQVRAFQCSSECCKDQAGSHESLQRCLENCMKPVVELQEKTGNEVNQLQVSEFILLVLCHQSCCACVSLYICMQDRLSRCALNCQDEIKDSLPDSPSPQQQEQAQRRAEECLMRCEDSHITLIPPIVKRLRAAMNCK